MSAHGRGQSYGLEDPTALLGWWWRWWWNDDIGNRSSSWLCWMPSLRPCPVLSASHSPHFNLTTILCNRQRVWVNMFNNQRQKGHPASQNYWCPGGLPTWREIFYSHFTDEELRFQEIKRIPGLLGIREDARHLTVPGTHRKCWINSH